MTAARSALWKWNRVGREEVIVGTRMNEMKAVQLMAILVVPQ